MASHHPHFHPPPPTPTPTCYCHCYYADYTPCHHHAPPPPDPYLHHHHHPPPPPQPHLPNVHQYAPRYEERCYVEEKQSNPAISSLLRRIAALESALLRRSSDSHSLRDAAARTIQTHFRAFLLRRSRTLRQLKELASIKSELSILKSSIAEETHIDYDFFYRKARGLLLKLVSIRGGDPMIRDGKIAISRELNRFLDYIGGFSVDRRELSIGVKLRSGANNNVKARGSNRERNMGNVKCGDVKRVNEEKLRGLVERIDKLAVELDEEESEAIESPGVRMRRVSGNRTGGLMKQHGGVQPKEKKRVSFVENGKVYRLVKKNGELIVDEDFDDSIEGEDLVDARELGDVLCREVEEIGVSSKEGEDEEDEEALSEDGDSQPGSDGEIDLRSYPRGKK